MMLLRYLFVFLFIIPSSWTEIGKKNRAIKEAAKSYAETDYEKSVADHLRLSSEFGISSPNASFNLALSYHYNGQVEEAQRTYQSLQSSTDKLIASFAANQNGIILAQQNKYQEALSAFKFSLIKDPYNEEARYNYELLSRWLQEDPERQQQEDQGEDQDQQQDQEDQQDQDQQKQSQENKDGEGDEKTEEDKASESQKKEDKSGEKSQEERDSDEPSELESDLSDREKAMEKLREKLQEMNLTPEQAAQILEAMNAAELRYIQQNRKKPSKRPDRGLPEW